MDHQHYAAPARMYNVHNKPEAAAKVRFWEEINGSLVKITMKKGDYIHNYHHVSTEEGYDDIETELTFDGFEIVKRTNRHARDCDGSLHNSWREVAKGTYKDHEGLTLPDYNERKI